MRTSWLLVVALGVAACSSGTLGTQSAQQIASIADTVTMSSAAGALIATDSLIAVDGNALPCCNDSTGTIVSGVLLFHRAASYADSAPTPAGWAARACVQEVPNGAHVGRNGLVTLTDGSSYLTLPCSAGYFTLTVTTQRSQPEGFYSPLDTLTAGAYAWQPGVLVARSASIPINASLSGSTIMVTTGGHAYQFVALP